MAVAGGLRATPCGLEAWGSGAAIHRHCESRFGKRNGEVSWSHAEVDYLGEHLGKMSNGQLSGGLGASGSL